MDYVNIGISSWQQLLSNSTKKKSIYLPENIHHLHDNSTFIHQFLEKTFLHCEKMPLRINSVYRFHHHGIHTKCIYISYL